MQVFDENLKTNLDSKLFISSYLVKMTFASSEPNEL